MTVTKSRDTRLIAQEYIDAYLEMVFSAMAMRIPEVHQYLTKNFPEASVTSSYEGQHLNIRASIILEEIAREGLTKPKSLRRSFDQINGIFIGAMWDVLCSHRDYDRISTEPEIQFFRHVRNACAHSGMFNFSELRHPATWRDKEITMELVGHPIFPDFLADGDPVLLLLDINNLYFQQWTVPGYVTP